LKAGRAGPCGWEDLGFDSEEGGSHGGLWAEEERDLTQVKHDCSPTCFAGDLGQVSPLLGSCVPLSEVTDWQP
jgi:hypothetical protein